MDGEGYKFGPQAILKYVMFAELLAPKKFRDSRDILSILCRCVCRARATVLYPTRETSIKVNYDSID